MHASSSHKPSDGSDARKQRGVSWGDTDLGESARLLETQAFSTTRMSGGNGTSTPFAEHEAPSPPALAPPQQPVMQLAAPADLVKPPTDVDAWPKEPLRIACTHCGHYIETILNEETEYMGCKPCFNSKPVFRRSFVHYCPNCNEAIGFHYPGEDCYCAADKSTMSFCSVFEATCCAWKLSDYI